MTATTPAMSIGALAKRTGCSIQTIRYYERIRLLPKAPRRPGGHRIYDERHADRLALVRKGRALGLSIKEVRGLVGLAERAILPCREARDLAEAHLGEIVRRIAELRALQRTLAAYVADCGAKCGEAPQAECGIATGLLGKPSRRAA
jgi:DNA-binding transcriptional MerR regulator